MTTNPDRSTWQQIADDLRKRIDEGEFDTGERRLPPRRQLMDEYGVADRTVARALHQLGDEGYLISRSTAGWFVRDRRRLVRSTRSRLSRSERAVGRGTFTTDCHEAGLQASVSTDVRTEHANESVAAALGIAAGDEVCVRERVMRGNDEVLQLATSYLPRTITAGTAIEEVNTGPGGIYARLEEAGYVLTSYTERVSIVRASDRIARQMAVNIGEPLFHIQRTAHAGERVIEVNEITITGNQYELLYEVPAE